MSIRCTSKALIIRDGCILLNRCRSSRGRIYYDLPGGGQHVYEPMECALEREVLEETGLHIRIVRFAALAEEIYTSAGLRAQYPDYTHRIMHIFLAEPASGEASEPTETDFGMEASVWIPIGQTAKIPCLLPDGLAPRLSEILSGGPPIWLGTRFAEQEGP